MINSAIILVGLLSACLAQELSNPSSPEDSLQNYYSAFLSLLQRFNIPSVPVQETPIHPLVEHLKNIPLRTSAAQSSAVSTIDDLSKALTTLGNTEPQVSSMISVTTTGITPGVSPSNPVASKIKPSEGSSRPDSSAVDAPPGSPSTSVASDINAIEASTSGTSAVSAPEVSSSTPVASAVNTLEESISNTVTSIVNTLEGSSPAPISSTVNNAEDPSSPSTPSDSLSQLSSSFSPVLQNRPNEVSTRGFINAPVQSCRNGQKRDIKGYCRDVY